MQTLEGGKTLRKTMIEKYGSEEAWKQVMRERGSEGGKNGTSSEVIGFKAEAKPLDINNDYTVLNTGVIIGIKGLPMKPQLDQKGYQRVQVKVPSKHNGVVTLKMHRVVASHFIPNPENLPQVDHLDADKCNNHVSNLEWVTNAENARRAVQNGAYLKRTPKNVIELGGQILTAIDEGYYSTDLFKLNDVPGNTFWKAVDRGDIYEEEISTIKLGRKKKYYYFDKSRNKWRVERSDYKPGKQFNTEEEAMEYAQSGIGGGFYSNRKLASIAGKRGGLARTGWRKYAENN